MYLIKKNEWICLINVFNDKERVNRLVELLNSKEWMIMFDECIYGWRKKRMNRFDECI